MECYWRACCYFFRKNLLTTTLKRSRFHDAASVVKLLSFSYWPILWNPFHTDLENCLTCPSLTLSLLIFTYFLYVIVSVRFLFKNQTNVLCHNAETCLKRIIRRASQFFKKKINFAVCILRFFEYVYRFCLRDKTKPTTMQNLRNCRI